MPASILEPERCADCYALLYPDEMNRCQEGHFVCPGCVCDCDMLAEARLHMALWTGTGEWRPHAQLETGAPAH